MAEAEIKVMQYPEGHVRAGLWGYTINGQDAQMGFSNEAGAHRSARRLLAGQTREVRDYGRVTVEPVEATGEDGKPTTEWYYSLDGERAEEPSRNRTEAMQAGAIAAFLSRGVLGRKAEVEAACCEQTGCRSCECVIDENGRVTCKTEKGDYAVNFQTLDQRGEDGRPLFSVQFKPLSQHAPHDST